MKHLLNNLSEEEKNRIREQHEGGMNVAIDNFKTLVETKSGDVKPFLVEQKKGGTPWEPKGDELYLLMDVLKKGGIDFGVVAGIPDFIMRDNGAKWSEAYNEVYNHTSLRFQNALNKQGVSEQMDMDKQKMPIGSLKESDLSVLAKKIVDCLDDEGKKLLFRLNFDSKNHRPFFDMAMIEMNEYINSFGPKGPLG